MSDTITIQCLQKRKGGSIHTMGHHLANQKKFHFKPIDEKDDESPHVRVFDPISESEYISDFLAVKEGFRVYAAGSPVLAIPQTQTVVNPDKKNRYDDLLSVDAELVDAIWLEGYSREVLEIDPKSTQLLKEYLDTSYGLTLAGKANNQKLLRAILIADIAEQKAASEQAALTGKSAPEGSEEDKGSETE